MTAVLVAPAPRVRVRPGDAVPAGLFLGATLALGAAVALRPLAAVGIAVALVAVAAVAARPVAGVYALLVLTPLTAGIDRGTLLPLLRPNEAVCGVVALALVVRRLVLLRSARELTVRIDRVAAVVLALAVTSSVVPLLWLRVRGIAATSDDLLYALPLWKFFVVFLVVRAARLDDRQVRRALQLSVAAAVLIGVVSLLQVTGWHPVISLLRTYYTTNDNVNAITSNRGSSTLGLPIAVADLLTFNLAIVMGMIWLRGRATPALVAVGLLLTLGVVGSGEFSGVIGLVVGVIAICVVTRSGFPARFLLGCGGVAVPVVWPVIRTRLAGFDSLSGLPISWTGRLNNLHSYFWPVLFSHHRYLLGVRPAARIVAPHRANGFIWIESGYTWLLWAGGIPFLLAFLAFAVVAVRAGLTAVHRGSEPRRIAGLATVVAVTMICVLMIFDPHLTYRGVADELFVLLALCTTAVPTHPERTPHG